ncbi:hypothetical protein NliqN6_2195 [Naganishia liquefaciens]|uniref:Uricase n=1 Tax=Naganishia liquefaciens TaxID=104408 RepID=A0A8H3YE15_9TREE|nr:hypothetical protein NliqN6_2195 [Naganishia liquefaciens]
MSDEVGYLSAARYGKDLVRVCRVTRQGDTHHVVEYTARVLLEGDIETSYTKADNSVVVATDTVKNTIYILSKTSPHVHNPPAFALHIALHFTSTYPHIKKCYVDLQMHKWSRIQVAGKAHGWAFERNGDEKGVVEACADSSAGQDKTTAYVKVGLKDLLVLKTAGSSFTNFHRDQYTTLQEVDDRLFSTSVDLKYDVQLPPNVPLTIANIGKVDKFVDFQKTYEKTRQATLEVFATDESASVQATMYKTAQRVLKESPAIKNVTYAYPNKHYIPVNLTPFKLDNGLGREGGAEVFHPVADPSGYITATITRKDSRSSKL